MIESQGPTSPLALPKTFVCNMCKEEKVEDDRVKSKDLQTRNECRACCAARSLALRNRIKKDREEYGY